MVCNQIPPWCTGDGGGLLSEQECWTARRLSRCIALAQAHRWHTKQCRSRRGSGTHIPIRKPKSTDNGVAELITVSNIQVYFLSLSVFCCITILLFFYTSLENSTTPLKKIITLENKIHLILTSLGHCNVVYYVTGDS